MILPILIGNRDVDISLLNAMLHSSAVPHTPLLVMATSLSSDSDNGVEAVQIAEWLSLVHIQHPWQVRCRRCCNVSDVIYIQCELFYRCELWH